ncbi:unnamed protein product [Eruca vesicaria subsp. sativa]|uniref:Uncharacterized protein n=1 Tax=Eruca vesicaria subsp. sativa TaxID=29727 RepID=A0ABC8IY55_ERUVS|nr:unnamed protein product [Eruca vesicaria subsp. sativa]
MKDFQRQLMKLKEQGKDNEQKLLNLEKTVNELSKKKSSATQMELLQKLQRRPNLRSFCNEGTQKACEEGHGSAFGRVKAVAAGANPVLTTTGIEKKAKALVAELKKMSKEVEDSELADVAAVSAGSNAEIGTMIAEAMSRVGRKGVVTLEEGKKAENAMRLQLSRLQDLESARASTLTILPFSLEATVIREEVGLSLDKAGKEVLGHAAKVERCCLEYAASVARKFLKSHCVVEIKEPKPVPAGNPMDNSGYGTEEIWDIK